jgi:O-antigen/teichoic acid export membrane protein
MRQALEKRAFPAGLWQGANLVAAVTLAYGLDYLFNIVAGRMLDPAEFSIVVALAGAGQILVVGSRVIQTVVARYVSRFQAQPDGAVRASSFFHSVFRASWRWGAVALLIALLLSWPVARFLQIPSLGPVLALAVATLLMVVRPVVGGALQGIQRFGALGSVQVIQALARLLLGALLITLGWGAFGAMVALPLASALALVYGWFALRGYLADRAGSHHAVSVREFFDYSSYAAAGLLGFALLINMDALLVRRYFDPLSAGHYSAAITLGKVIQFFPLAIILVLFPKAAQRHASRRDPSDVLLPAMLIVATFCGAIALAYALFPQQIVSLALGPGYRVEGPVLGLVGLAMLLLSLANVWLNYYLSTDWKPYVVLVAVGIFVQAGLMILFHRELWQLPAAMAANGLWLTLAGTVAYYRRRTRQPA